MHGHKDGVTVADALADRASELMALIAWATTRLERARDLADLGKGLARLADTDPYGSAGALDLAGRLVAAVGEETAENPVGVETLTLQAKAVMLSAGAGDWNPAHVAGMTVAELAAALPAPAAEKVAAAES